MFAGAVSGNAKRGDFSRKGGVCMEYSYPFLNPSLTSQNPSLTYPARWNPAALNVNLGGESQRYFLSLPEEEQLLLLKNCQGSQEELEKELLRRKWCE